jgi:DNA-binding response OmpR family regulator
MRGSHSAADRGSGEGNRPRTPSIRSFADLRLDPARYRVWRGERLIHVSPTGFRILAHLMERPERVVSRGQLIEAVWGFNAELEERTVDVHIRHLRRALCAGGKPDLIRTVRAFGYALDTPLPARPQGRLFPDPLGQSPR